MEVRRLNKKHVAPEDIAYSSDMDTYKDAVDFIDGRMKAIEQISLEDDAYNELYLALRESRNAVLKVIRAQYEVEKKEEGNILWENLKKFRRPEEELDLQEK